MDQTQPDIVDPILSPGKKRRLLTGLLFIAVLGAIATGVLVFNHIQYRSNIISQTKNELQQRTLKATQEIEQILRKVTEDADAIADELTNKRQTKTMLARLKRIIQNNPYYFGGTITYKEYGFDSRRKLYSAYYKRTNKTDKLEFVQLDTIYDYREHDWYRVAIQSGNNWVEPYWGPAGKTFMTTYSSVFYQTDPATGEKMPLGVVTIDISMDQIKTQIESLELGPSGFGALVSRKGIYLHHPNHEYVLAGKTLRDIAKEKNDNDRIIMAEKSARGESGILDHISTTTGRASWLVFHPITITGWSLQNTFLKDDLPINVDVLRHQLMWIVLAFISTALCLLCLYLLAKPRNEKLIWTATITISSTIALSILCIWGISLEYNPEKKVLGTLISDKVTLLEIINDNSKRAKNLHLDNPIYIPTGLFIESIKLTDVNDAIIAGYVWQKYIHDLPENMKNNFSFSRANNLKITEIDRKYEKDHEVIRYYFQVEIRHKLNPVYYPLEKEHIRLNIINKELKSNIVLVPDLDAYALLNSSLLPGLDKGVFISGWNLKNTYYELRPRKISTNFGQKKTIEKNIYLALYYNIEIQRDYVDAFISNLTPLIIVSILLFFLLLLSKKLDSTRVFSICVAMFFVIVFSHLDIRRKISAHEIFYLEYFFFITYFAILWVVINAMANLVNYKIWFFQYRDNLMPRTLFWPVFLATIITVTVMTFY